MGEIWGEIYTEPIKAFRFHFSLAKYVCQKSSLLIYYWHLVNKVGVKERPLFCLCVGCNLICVSQGFSKDIPSPVLPECQGWAAGRVGKIRGCVGWPCTGWRERLLSPVLPVFLCHNTWCFITTKQFLWIEGKELLKCKGLTINKSLTLKLCW